MTGGVKLEFPATTINEAVMLATEKWRVLAEDPEATLPWSTHVEFHEVRGTDIQDGRVVEKDTQMMVLVRIEFDRKIVDELTGATSAA
jgi:hypothetical protein